MRSSYVSFPSNNLTLEGVLTAEKSPDPLLPAVVVCHPHPLYGGDMDNIIVQALCQELKNAGIVTLRFNFRGVGQSEGSHDEGNGEQDDLRAALTYLEETEGIDPFSLGVAGYSFGATVAMNVAATDNRVEAFAAIALPLRGRVPDPPANFSIPGLIVTGDRDPFVPMYRFKPLSRNLPPTVETRIIQGADHFWSDHAQEMTAAVGSFFRRHFRKPVPGM